jgi:hypothetical protein
MPGEQVPLTLTARRVRRCPGATRRRPPRQLMTAQPWELMDVYLLQRLGRADSQARQVEPRCVHVQCVCACRLGCVPRVPCALCAVRSARAKVGKPLSVFIFYVFRVQAMPPNVPAPEEAGAASAAVASAESDTLAGNDSLDSGASTKPDEGLKSDDMLE